MKEIIKLDERREITTDNTKVVKAMERIEALYHDTDGKCYVSFSGGKDSTVILALIKMCEQIYTLPPDAMPAVFCNTGIELGATVDFIKWVKDNYYPNVQIIRPDPKKPFDWIIKNCGKPIKSKMKSEMLHRWHVTKNENSLRSLVDTDDKLNKTKIANKDLHLIHPDFDINASHKCCMYLKKKPFEKYNKDTGIKGFITGLRSGEGGARQLQADARIKNGGSLCTAMRGGLINKLPIIDWTDKDIEDFINEYNVPLSKAYTEQGYERTGCFLCPYSLQLQGNLVKLHKYEPLRYKAAMHWLKDVYIAQGVSLPFDAEYEAERIKKWNDLYYKMRYEMLKKYRPDRAKKFNDIQTDIFDFMSG